MATIDPAWIGLAGALGGIIVDRVLTYFFSTKPDQKERLRDRQLQLIASLRRARVTSIAAARKSALSMYFMTYNMSMASMGAAQREVFQPAFKESRVDTEEAFRRWSDEFAALSDTLVQIRAAFSMQRNHEKLINQVLNFDLTALEPGEWSRNQKPEYYDAELGRLASKAAKYVEDRLGQPLANLSVALERQFFET